MNTIKLWKILILVISTVFANNDSEYVTVVWVGNADGEGRPGLTGTSVAAPIMFDVFNELPKTTWFKTPYADIEEVEVCLRSGDLPSSYCDETSIEMMPKNCVRAKQCVYHKKIHLNYEINQNILIFFLNT